MKTTNYTDTLIEIAEDCPALLAEEPPLKGGLKTIARMQYEMIRDNPNKFTSDDVIFSVYAIKNDISKKDFE